MRKARYFPALLGVVFLMMASCRKTYTYPGVPLSSYYPLQVGKWITYRLDSLTFYYYGQLDTITSYMAKDSVEMATTDNAGRPAWLVTRYLSDTTGTQPWVPSETYLVIPSAAIVEVLEQNLRYEKLSFPVQTGFTWAGNNYLPYAPFQDFFQFSYDSHLTLSSWVYSYEQVNAPFSVGNQLFDSTSTVLMDSSLTNVPILDPTIPASDAYWTETYAKNIGLVYRHTAMWEYQPPTANGTQLGYKIGFEMTLSILDHN